MVKTTTGFALGLFGAFLLLQAAAPRPRTAQLLPLKKWPAPPLPFIAWTEFAAMAVSETVH